MKNMESEDLDNKIRERLMESESMYSAQANLAQERIWQQVERKETLKVGYWYKIMAAAAVLLLLLTSTGFFYVIRQKNVENDNLKAQYNQLSLIASQQENLIQSQQEKIGDLTLKEMEVAQKHAGELLVSKQEGGEKRDTIYITKVKEVVKMQVAEQPLHLDLVELNLPEALEIAQEKQGLAENVKVQFIFNEGQKELTSKKKKSPGLRIGFGKSSGESGELLSKAKPLSIQTHF